jgi:hypothetical protein
LSKGRDGLYAGFVGWNSRVLKRRARVDDKAVQRSRLAPCPSPRGNQCAKSVTRRALSSLSKRRGAILRNATVLSFFTCFMA